MSLDDVNDRMDLDLPDDEADTIGGFVFNLLGHQALQGERVSYDGVDFIVEATDGRRITKVRLIRRPEPPDPEDGSSPPIDESDSRNGSNRRGIAVSGVESAP